MSPNDIEAFAAYTLADMRDLVKALATNPREAEPFRAELDEIRDAIASLQPARKEAA